MNIIYMLLAISVIVAIAFFVAFVVSVRKGQYDDVYTPSVRMLFDDELVTEPQDKEPIENQSIPTQDQQK
ncbi:MAG: cbb3-type cytochrome oxidase assembly protein CcoS [Marinirhabdus sp.]|nr:cbb3-type cytochrome oxidase assembly protein CcoS [Marinirhabdus sp.]